jgi:salicylate hydroxylase
VSEPSVAIVGGGIGGLCAAALLHRAGVPAVVYEQASRLSEVGAGIVVAPNAARLLRRLGVLETFAEKAVRLEVGWEFRRWTDGTVLSAEQLTDACARLYGEEMYTAHRADLLDAIRSAVPDESIRLGKRCVEVQSGEGRPRIRFADGEVCTPDVLVGADGIHSVVRGAVTDVVPATYSGLCAFRALVPANRAPDFARRPAHTLWIGPDHHLVHYPVSAGRSVNLVAFAPSGEYSVESWSATGTVDEFLAEFEGWDPRLTDLISAAGTPGRWALMDRPPLQRWSRDRITLLGDAAHAMFPFFAQGAAQAIEDAAVLAKCISDAPDDPIGALDRYESLRIDRTTRLQELSRARAHINHLPDGDEQRARDQALGDADPLVASGWIYAYDADRALAAEPPVS